MNDADLTPLKPGFTRLAILLDRPSTPGEVLRLLSLQPEQVDHIVVTAGQAQLDVLSDLATGVRERLAETHPVQLIATHELSWRWLRIHLGRNHGLTPGQLQKILAKIDAGPLGRYNINNTHTLIGLREDYLPRVIAAWKDSRVNGIRLRPEEPPPHEAKGQAKFVPRKS